MAKSIKLSESQIMKLNEFIGVDNKILTGDKGYATNEISTNDLDRTTPAPDTNKIARDTMQNKSGFLPYGPIREDVEQNNLNIDSLTTIFDEPMIKAKLDSLVADINASQYKNDIKKVALNYINSKVI